MDSSPGQLSNSSACLTDYVARHTKNANGFDHASPEALSGGHVVDGRRAAGGPSRARRPRDVTKTSDVRRGPPCNSGRSCCRAAGALGAGGPDRKSTRLNSSHLVISYAVFCLKKKKEILLHVVL